PTLTGLLERTQVALHSPEKTRGAAPRRPSFPTPGVPRREGLPGSMSTSRRPHDGHAVRDVEAAAARTTGVPVHGLVVPDDVARRRHVALDRDQGIRARRVRRRAARNRLLADAEQLAAHAAVAVAVGEAHDARALEEH